MKGVTLTDVLLGAATIAAGVPAVTAAIKKRIDFIAVSLTVAFAALLINFE
jgi:hypothetical protein